MTDQIREQMSALLDGELPQGEIGLLLLRMERDPGLQRAYGNYVLAGELLRSPGGVTAAPGFAARVSAAIAADEAQPLSSPVIPPRRPRRWLRPAAGAAVAAGAALVAVLAVRPDDGGDALIARVSDRAPPAMVLPAGGSSPTPAQNQRLARYLVAHGQYATPMGRRTVWSNALAADPGIELVNLGAAEQR